MGEKQTLVEQAADLQVQAANLQVQAAALQTQAANLQTQKVELQGQQQTAQSQQQQAEQLQTELTNELTKAGGDERGTDPRLVKLQNGLTATIRVKVVSPPRINKAGNAAIFTVVATTAPTATETADLVRTLRVYTIPQATAGTELQAHVGGQTASYVDLASGISSRLMLVILAVIALSFIVLLDRFPLARRRRPGRRRERPLGGCCVRGPDGGLPVGLGPETRGPRHRERNRSDRQLRPVDDVRRAVRTVDGLPGLPSSARSSTTAPPTEATETPWLEGSPQAPV